MTEPVAVLIVDGDPDDWFAGWLDNLGVPLAAVRDTIRIDGDLPTVLESGSPWEARRQVTRIGPLRVGDRVTLATWATFVTRPFATATVANIKFTMETDHLCESGYAVTVTDVEEL